MQSADAQMTDGRIQWDAKQNASVTNKNLAFLKKYM